MSMVPGATIGPYRIIEQVGRGGMATVYKAYQASLARYVAIKVLPAFFAEDEGFRERFQQEAIAIARLRHPNILVVFDYGEENGVTYLVSEFIDGGTLAEQLGAPLPLEYALGILTPIAAALDYAHARGILHRDVKPSNILLSRDGTPVLSDFGLAKMVGSMPRLTMTGMTIGTPEYMAPEQGMGEQVGPASDNYSLAVVAYEMLTGKVPFTAETPLAIVLAHLHKPLPSPRALNPDLPEGVEQALLKGLAKAPEDRYPTAAALAAALQDAARGGAAAQPTAPVLPTTQPATNPPAQPISASSASVDGTADPGAQPAGQAQAATQAGTPARRRIPRLAALLVAGVLLAAAGGGALLRQGGGRQSTAPTPTKVAALAATSTGVPSTATPTRARPTAVFTKAPTTPRPTPTSRPSPVPTATSQPSLTSTPTSRPSPLPTTTSQPSPIPTATIQSSPVPTATIARPTATRAAPTKSPTSPLRPNVAQGVWLSSFSPPNDATGQQAVRLADGRVLVAGGTSAQGSSVTARVTLYDPTPGRWSPAASMLTPRANFSAVLLRSGKVLAIGGDTGGTLTPTSELYDPARNTWTPAGSMSEARQLFTTTLLSSGDVLVVGGEDAKYSLIAGAELYNAGTGRWQHFAAPTFVQHTATLLQDGAVLVAESESAYLFNPSSHTWTAINPMRVRRNDPTATLLANGKVLVAGGFDYTHNTVLASAELYDPITHAWTMTGSMHVARARQTATLLSDGRVLVAGGETLKEAPIASAELYDPARGTWMLISAMHAPRSRHLALLLRDGRVLVAGGEGANGALGTLDLFKPALASGLATAAHARVVAAARSVARTGPDSASYRYFPASHHSLAGPFLVYWQQHLGPILLGLPLTEPFSQGGEQRQYCERGLLRLSHGVVSLTPLGRQLTQNRHFSPGIHAVDPLFRHYYADHEGQEMLGAPLAGVHSETNGDGSGRAYLTQWFENGRLEYHPELPDRYRVLPGLVGKQALALAKQG